MPCFDSTKLWMAVGVAKVVAEFRACRFAIEEIGAQLRRLALAVRMDLFDKSLPWTHWQSTVLHRRSQTAQTTLRRGKH